VRFGRFRQCFLTDTVAQTIPIQPDLSFPDVFRRCHGGAQHGPVDRGGSASSWSPVQQEAAAFGHAAHESTTLLMVGMATVLSLCEAATPAQGRRTPEAIAERLSRAANSGIDRAKGAIQQLGARRIDAGERNGLFPMLPALSWEAGLTRDPEIYLYPGSSANAFALGDRASSIILISEGLVARLNAKEMTGVLAHEIGHILNADARLLAIAAELNQMIVDAVRTIIAAEMAPPAFASGTRANGPTQSFDLLIVAAVVSCLLQHGLSRTREYHADQVAAGLMGQPFWLIDALGKLNPESAAARFAPSSLSNAVAMLMRSHPDGHERVNRLFALAQTSTFRAG
jgi:Zn-dependent protease with chaperone function